MARKKISEYRAKNIIFEVLGLPYVGWSITSADSAPVLSQVHGYDSYVVKVDQAIKGRFKKGLVLLDVKESDLPDAVKKLEESGYQSFLVEPYVSHTSQSEYYLSIAYDRRGHLISYSSQGGVDVESNSDSIETFRIDDGLDWELLADRTKIDASKLQSLIRAFDDNFFVFLEINPYIKTGDGIAVLDTAVEVDDAGQPFVETWDDGDIRETNNKLTEQEKIVKALNKGSVASFNLSVLNPNGSIFLLLSGGGASIVVADEVYNKGFGKELANYGEYSGNPDLHETYKYTSQVLELILQSAAPKKILFIGGAVANFTDIATTFAGIINAIEENAAALTEQHVTVYVRRGGPNQEVGLKNITACLKKHGLYGGVYDNTTTITNALDVALEGLK